MARFKAIKDMIFEDISGVGMKEDRNILHSSLSLIRSRWGKRRWKMEEDTEEFNYSFWASKVKNHVSFFNSVQQPSLGWLWTRKKTIEASESTKATRIRPNLFHWSIQEADWCNDN